MHKAKARRARQGRQARAVLCYESRLKFSPFLTLPRVKLWVPEKINCMVFLDGYYRPRRQELRLIDIACPPCKGQGLSLPGTMPTVSVCLKCSGKKTIQIEAERLVHPCRQCDQTGLRSGGPQLCPTCRGDGYDRPGEPTGPGHAHLTLPSIQMGPAIPGGISEITEPILPPEPPPEQKSGVNIEVPTDQLTITTYPPTVEIEEAVKRRFASAPQAVISDAQRAVAITEALQEILVQARSNSDEASEAKTLLEQQRAVLSDVIEALQSGSNEKAARESALELLDSMMASILRNWAREGPVRWTLAIAAFAFTSVLGVTLDWTVQLLIAGSFVGEGVIEKLKNWGSRD